MLTATQSCNSNKVSEFLTKISGLLAQFGGGSVLLAPIWFTLLTWKKDLFELENDEVSLLKAPLLNHLAFWSGIIPAVAMWYKAYSMQVISSKDHDITTLRDVMKVLHEAVAFYEMFSEAESEKKTSTFYKEMTNERIEQLNKLLGMSLPSLSVLPIDGLQDSSYDPDLSGLFQQINSLKDQFDQNKLAVEPSFLFRVFDTSADFFHKGGAWVVALLMYTYLLEPTILDQFSGKIIMGSFVGMGVLVGATQAVDHWYELKTLKPKNQDLADEIEHYVGKIADKIGRMGLDENQNITNLDRSSKKMTHSNEAGKNPMAHNDYFMKKILQSPGLTRRRSILIDETTDLLDIGYDTGIQHG